MGYANRISLQLSWLRAGVAPIATPPSQNLEANPKSPPTTSHSPSKTSPGHQVLSAKTHETNGTRGLEDSEEVTVGDGLRR